MTSAGERPWRPSHERKSFILTSCFTGGCWTTTVTVVNPWPLLLCCSSRWADGCGCEPDTQVEATDTAVLDLRERSVARGQSQADAGQAPLEIPRTAKHLIVDLPIGSKEGTYDVGLLTETGDQIMRATGSAQLHGHITDPALILSRFGSLVLSGPDIPSECFEGYHW
jgi:hypothetical protein